MQVAAKQIQIKPFHTYQLWEGEMQVHVHQHMGVHRFYSAVIVVERMDSPLATFSWDGYTQPKPTELDMRTWIAERLTGLSAGLRTNGFVSCEIVGLAVPNILEFPDSP